NDEKPANTDTPTQSKIIQVTHESLLPLPVNHLVNSAKSAPANAPKATAPKISFKGVKIVDASKPIPKISAFAIAIESPNPIIATASSIATTDIKVSVKGPFALYCRTTIKDAAGA